MSSGALLLGGVTLVALGDIAIALYFRGLADKVESGEVVREGFDPAGMRKVALMLLVAAPLMWLAVGLVSLGVIPTGLDSVQLGAAR